MSLLPGRVAIVTGASKGIGRAMSELFAREGAKVVCAARSADLVGDTAAAIVKAGGQAVAVAADAAQEDGARAIVDATGAPFLLHREDLGIAEYMPEAALRWMGRTVAPAPTPDGFPEDGQDIEVAGVTLRVIHTPGHTPGSVSLYAAEAHLLFSGDTLFRESIGRTDLPGGDTDTILSSIAQRLYTLPEDTRVLPGHMQETTIAHEREHNPFVRAPAR